MLHDLAPGVYCITKHPGSLAALDHRLRIIVSLVRTCYTNLAPASHNAELSVATLNDAEQFSLSQSKGWYTNVIILAAMCNAMMQVDNGTTSECSAMYNLTSKALAG